MRTTELLALVIAVAACTQDHTGPKPLVNQHTVVFQSEADGPPQPHDFGPDTYRTGLFTGEGVTEPGLKCRGNGTGGRVCT